MCRVSDAGQESRPTFTGGRRPKAAKERTRGEMVRGEYRVLRYGDLAEAEGVGAGAQSPLRGLITRLADSGSSACRSNIIVECRSCGLVSMMGRRICARVVAAGPQPALGEVVTASSGHSDLVMMYQS